MGISLEEIEPVLGLDQDHSRQLARDIFVKKEKHSGSITQKNLVEALKAFDQQTSPTHFSLPPTLEDMINALIKAGWLETDHIKQGFNFCSKIGEVANASNAPRMTFEEARHQIIDLISRLNDAPEEKEGIKINRILIYGSTIRDTNARETIGDIDLIADVTFEDPTKCANQFEREMAIGRAWGPIISKGDERIGLRIDIDSLHHIFDPDTNRRDHLQRPLVLMQLWMNNAPGPSSLSAEQLNAIGVIEQRTIASNHRAQNIAEAIKSTTHVRPKPQREPAESCIL